MCLRCFILLLVFIASTNSRNLTSQDDGYQRGVINVYGTTPPDVKCDGTCGDAVFLTQYIKENDIKGARCAARAKRCVNMHYVRSYSGFLNINATYNSNIWFKYFPATGKQEDEAPLLVWAQGGPGAYATYGLFGVFGPYILDTNGAVIKNNYTWIQDHSVLIVDVPVGSGFSFTDDDRGYADNQAMVGEQYYSAFQQILTIFPELQVVPIILVGTHYGAKHAVALGHQIMKNKDKTNVSANLQGVLLFNGILEVPSQFQDREYGLVTGLVNKQTADTIGYLENAGADYIRAGRVTEGILLYNKSLTIYIKARSIPNPFSIAANDFRSSKEFISFIQSPSIRCKLNVGNTKLRIADKAHDKLRLDVYGGTVRYWLQDLMNNYRVLLATGILTPLAPYYQTSKFYNTLEFDGAEEFRNATRQFYRFNGTVRGYSKASKKVISMVLRNVGNVLAAEDLAQTLDIVTNFAYNKTSIFLSD